MEQNKHTNLGKSPEEIQAIRQELAKLLSMSDSDLANVDLSKPIGMSKTASNIDSVLVTSDSVLENEDDVEMADPEEDEIFKNIMEERRLAAAKANPAKRIKGRTTVVVKEATAFGEVNKEVSVERELGKTGDNSPEAKEAALEEQMKEILAQKGITTDDAKIAEAKAIRAKLSGLWSDDISKTSSADDMYIEGVPGDGGGTRNPDAGNSGVRISFRGKPKQ